LDQWEDPKQKAYVVKADCKEEVVITSGKFDEGVRDIIQ
jgi:hypothetical protein